MRVVTHNCGKKLGDHEGFQAYVKEVRKTVPGIDVLYLAEVDGFLREDIE